MASPDFAQPYFEVIECHLMAGGMSRRDELSMCSGLRRLLPQAVDLELIDALPLLVLSTGPARAFSEVRPSSYS